jgi:alkanesulfonate monooxygenase SsuD/methylene tetrahydromethanopterin reductase-like flavin-dependent oxidoreductase (luciferase family)
VAKYAQHWNFVGGTPEEFAHKRDVLHARCEDIGRDPREITLSAHVWLKSGSDVDIGEAVDAIAGLGEQGLELAILYLLPPLNASVIGPLAAALAPLR